MGLRLVLPSRRYVRSFRKALLEEGKSSKYRLELQTDYVSHIRAAARAKSLANREVERTEFWLVNGKQYLGRVQIRHKPSGSHPSIKSHIYYEVRPGERGKGYGTTLLHLAVPKAKALGINEIIAACAKSNFASRRIIEKNGGTLIRMVRVPRSNSEYLIFKIKAGHPGRFRKRVKRRKVADVRPPVSDRQ